jgi:hypothetical protein
MTPKRLLSKSVDSRKYKVTFATIKCLEKILGRKRLRGVHGHHEICMEKFRRLE